MKNFAYLIRLGAFSFGLVVLAGCDLTRNDAFVSGVSANSSDPNSPHTGLTWGATIDASDLPGFTDHFMPLSLWQTSGEGTISVSASASSGSSGTWFELRKYGGAWAAHGCANPGTTVAEEFASNVRGTATPGYTYELYMDVLSCSCAVPESATPPCGFVRPGSQVFWGDADVYIDFDIGIIE